MTATEIREFEITIPANTQQSAPSVTDTQFDSMTVDTVVIKVPPGPSGYMGFQLTMDGQQVIPINSGAWIVTDDEVITLQMADLPNSGQWQVTGYNTDIYDHTIRVRFMLEPTTAAAVPASIAQNDLTTAIVLSTAAG